MAITFNATIKTKLPARQKLKTWLSAIVCSEKKVIKNLSYNFCSDNELLEINQKFLKHNTYTDIITFDYSAPDHLTGEIYISTERVAENASKLHVPFEDELLRVIAHGLLHLCGYKDKTPQHAKKMRAAENRCIALFSAALQ